MQLSGLWIVVELFPVIIILVRATVMMAGGFAPASAEIVLLDGNEIGTALA